ncbi:hypothetical protein AB9F35_36580, partial [Rhizobium leguminosarum]
WGHALCHRIEGDDLNADYWYRRAGKMRGMGSMADEWSAMRAELSAKALGDTADRARSRRDRKFHDYLLVRSQLNNR